MEEDPEVALQKQGMRALQDQREQVLHFIAVLHFLKLVLLTLCSETRYS